MSAHTPAPWYWSDNVPDFPKNHRIIVDADGFTIAEPSPMSEADARLIAAAPELLAALQELLSYGAALGWDELDPTHDTRPETMRRARAAIAKATGGAA